jgi:hypothetical protein
MAINHMQYIPNRWSSGNNNSYTINDVEKIFKLILDKGNAQILFSLKSEDELENTIAKNLLKFYSKVKEK